MDIAKEGAIGEKLDIVSAPHADDSNMYHFKKQAMTSCKRLDTQDIAHRTLMIQLTLHSMKGSITSCKHVDRNYMRSLDHDITTHHRTSFASQTPASMMGINQLRIEPNKYEKPSMPPKAHAPVSMRPETTGTSKTSIDQSTSRLDPPPPSSPPSAGSQLQEQKHITHHKPGSAQHIHI